MPCTLFIADLHLDASRPAAMQRFLHLLGGRARQSDALYILGDLFEYWLGDDAPTPERGAFAAVFGSLRFWRLALVNLALAWAEEYIGLRPEVRISVTGGGPGTGIAAMINGTVDIANASRAMKPEEITAAQENGIAPVEFAVARHRQVVDPGDRDHGPGHRTQPDAQAQGGTGRQFHPDQWRQDTGGRVSRSSGVLNGRRACHSEILRVPGYRPDQSPS